MLNPLEATSNKLKINSNKSPRGAQTISDYMQSIKARADELDALEKPLDQEDLIEKILDGLNDEYQSVIDVVNGRETTISFDELHEKLINKELTLQQKTGPSHLLATANPTYTRTKSGPSNNRLSSFSPKTGQVAQKLTPEGRVLPRPFLGRCQWCNTKGHVLANCLIFAKYNQICKHHRTRGINGNLVPQIRGNHVPTPHGSRVHLNLGPMLPPQITPPVPTGFSTVVPPIMSQLISKIFPITHHMMLLMILLLVTARDSLYPTLVQHLLQFPLKPLLYLMCYVYLP